MDVITRENPVVEKIGQMQPTPGASKQRCESGCSGQRTAQQIRSTNRYANGQREGHEKPKKNKGVKEKQRVVPIGPNISPKRAGKRKVQECNDADQQSPPKGLTTLRLNNVIPSDQMIVACDTPIGARRGDGPFHLVGADIG